MVHRSGAAEITTSEGGGKHEREHALTIGRAPLCSPAQTLRKTSDLMRPYNPLMRLRFGACVFDSELRELSRSGRRMPLTPKAYALLEALVQARPQPISRDDLARLLWPDTFVEPGNLHNLVSEIRAATGDDEHAIIRTVHRFGYSFDAAGAAEERVSYVLTIGDDEIPLREGENTIGRDPTDTVVLNAPEVSRRHARLTLAGSRITLEDLGSKNGTFIGNVRVTAPTDVEPGADIVIGTTRIRVSAASGLPSTRTAV